MRYNQLDAWRGLACVGMFIFHLEAMRIFIIQVPSLWLFEWPGVVLGQFVRISFLLLVGVSTWLIYNKNKDFSEFAKKQIKRFAKVGLAAMIVTLVTYVLTTDYFIIFGILHLIAVANLLMIGFAKMPRWMNVVLGVGLIALGYVDLSLQFGEVTNFLLGEPFEGFVSFDYFPLIPWIGYVMVGFGFGDLLVKHIQSVKISENNILSKLGKRALEFYLIHLAFIFIFWQIVLVSVKS